jgi:hypothetical protein
MRLAFCHPLDEKSVSGYEKLVSICKLAPDQVLLLPLRLILNSFFISF